jgi:hypothetical protein
MGQTQRCYGHRESGGLDLLLDIQIDDASGLVIAALERLLGNSPSRDRWPNSWIVGDNR